MRRDAKYWREMYYNEIRVNENNREVIKHTEKELLTVTKWAGNNDEIVLALVTSTNAMAKTVDHLSELIRCENIKVKKED